MAMSDVLKALKELQAQMEGQKLAHQQYMQQCTARLNAHFDDLRSRLQGLSGHPGKTNQPPHPSFLEFSPSIPVPIPQPPPFSSPPTLSIPCARSPILLANSIDPTMSPSSPSPPQPSAPKTLDSHYPQPPSPSRPPPPPLPAPKTFPLTVSSDLSNPTSTTAAPTTTVISSMHQISDPPTQFPSLFHSLDPHYPLPAQQIGTTAPPKPSPPIAPLSPQQCQSSPQISPYSPVTRPLLNPPPVPPESPDPTSTLLRMKEVFDARQAQGGGPIIHLSCSLVSLYSKCGDMSYELQVFDRISDKDLATRNSLIDGYVKCKEIESERHMFDEMLDRDLFLWTTLVNGYSKCGKVEIARKLFDLIPEKSVIPWTAMVVGLGISGMADFAFKLFAKILRIGMKPNAITFVGVLNACSHAGGVDEGRRYFKVMKERDEIEPTLGVSKGVTTSSTKSTEFWQSKSDFCKAIGTLTSNDSVCFEGNTTSFNRKKCELKEISLNFVNKHMRLLFSIQCFYNVVNEELLHPVTLKVLIYWPGRPPEEVTCSFFASFYEQFPNHHLEDKVVLKGERMIRPCPCLGVVGLS